MFRREDPHGLEDLGGELLGIGAAEVACVSHQLVPKRLRGHGLHRLAGLVGQVRSDLRLLATIIGGAQGRS